MTVRSMVSVLVAVALMASASALADIPKTINFQGRLADTQGTPLEGTYDVTIRIYDARPSLLFTEAHPGVAVTDGLFNVLIGSRTVGGVPAAVFAAAETTVGISVGRDPEMTPRLPLASVPYAYVADAAQSLRVPASMTGAGNVPTLSVSNTGDGDGIVGTTAAASGDAWGGRFSGGSHWGGAVKGESANGLGVFGIHTSTFFVNPAVFGWNKGAGDGVMGECDGSMAGVRGLGAAGPGIVGASTSHNGVVGVHGGHFVSYTDANAGVYGKSTAGPGGRFESDTGPAVEAIGEVKADKFSYNSTQTRLLDIGPAAFKPISPRNYSCPYGNGGSLIWDTGYGTLSAPVQLPDGATITRMAAYYWDSNAADMDFRLLLHSNNLLPYQMATISSSGNSGYDDVDTTAIAASIVDNATKSYEVQVRANWPGNDTLKVMRVVISYTIDEAK